MKLEILKDNGCCITHTISQELCTDHSLDGKVAYIGKASKEENALNIFKAYFSSAKAILLDESNKSIVAELKSLEISAFNDIQKKETVFDKKFFSLLYFTSGSTGYPVGALKSKENIESEVKVLTHLLEKYKIKKVLVTVPFVHLYGTLLGLFYPLFNGIDIVLKEHFLPHDLLDLIEANTLIVTTPLYIKALNKLNERKDLSSSLFVSSTAPLDTESANLFSEKFQTDILQIFGSTETGGIAYKFNSNSIWIPFKSVELSTNSQGELQVSSPFVSKTLYAHGFRESKGTMQTSDYIEFAEEGFKLIGRSSKIFKIAGKRYSTVEIENILEEVEGIEKVLVFIELSKDALRGEYLDITIESQKKFTIREIKTILRKRVSNLKFSMTLKIVDRIPTNQVGKKLKI